MNKKFILIISAIILVIIAIFLIRFFSGEDSWIKDSRGVYIKHGSPSETPESVLEQQRAISKALELYALAKSEDTNFSSQCLGTFENYAIDIVHVPRQNIDNLLENQCEDYRTGKVSHFIELDKDGNIVRVF